jgi:cytochrome P450
VTVTQLSELDLPRFDYYGDVDGLRGERFHEVMAGLRERDWLASSEIAYFVLDREAASFFLRTRSATFPGMKIAELFGVTDGPLYEEMRRNILHVNGDQHRRLRNLVNPAFTPRAADRWRPSCASSSSSCGSRSPRRAAVSSWSPSRSPIRR